MACEEVYFGEFANGNTSDLEKATNIAKNMVTKYGMSSLGLGQISEVSGEMAKVVQDEINKILDECYRDTVELLKKNKGSIDKVVDYLMQNKEITEEEFITQFEASIML